MSELNTNAIPAINAVEGFNPADFVRNTVGEEGESDLYLDVKYRLLWFRLHEPGAFFSAYFSAYGEDLDFDLLQNPGALERLQRNRSVAEDGSLSIADAPYRVALEMYRQGLSILPADLIASHPVLFLQKEGGLLLPLRSLTSLSRKEIDAIAGARREGADSAEALARRAGLFRPALEALREKGILADTEDDGQLSLF